MLHEDHSHRRSVLMWHEDHSHGRSILMWYGDRSHGLSVLMWHGDHSHGRSVLMWHGDNCQDQFWCDTAIILTDNQFWCATGIIFTDDRYWVEQRRFALRHMREFGFGRRFRHHEDVVKEEIQDILDLLNGRREDKVTNDAQIHTAPSVYREQHSLTYSGNCLPFMKLTLPCSPEPTKVVMVVV
jgi:hypothetical protein